MNSMAVTGRCVCVCVCLGVGGRELKGRPCLEDLSQDISIQSKELFVVSEGWGK